MTVKTQCFLGTSRCAPSVVKAPRPHSCHTRKCTSFKTHAFSQRRSDPNHPVTNSRRSTLALVAVPLGLALISAQPALAEGLTSSTLAGAYVVPAMKVPAYLSRIQFARPQVCTRCVLTTHFLWAQERTKLIWLQESLAQICMHEPGRLCIQGKNLDLRGVGEHVIIGWCGAFYCLHSHISAQSTKLLCINHHVD